MEHDNLVSFCRILHRVCQFNNGAAVLKNSVNNFSELRAIVGIKSAGRLIEYKHLWLHGNNARKCAKSLLTTRKLKRGCVCLVGKSDKFQSSIHSACYIAGRKTQVSGAKRNVFGDCLCEKLTFWSLHDVTNNAVEFSAILFLSSIQTSYAKAAGVRCIKCANQTCQGRLAGTSGADNSNMRAFLHVN